MPEHLGFYKHGNLPHLDSEELLQFVTFNLADAAPSQQKSRFEKLYAAKGEAIFTELDTWLDRHSGSCLLRDPDLAGLVADYIQRQDGNCCRLLAWVVMPNHVHLLLQQLPGCLLGKIIKDIKGGSGKCINDLLGRRGSIWQRGYFDRFIRDLDQLTAIVSYIHDNPVNAGLCNLPQEWKFSSASTRDLRSILARLGWD